MLRDGGELASSMSFAILIKSIAWGGNRSRILAMREDLEDIPCNRRPKMLSPFPEGWKFFRTWSTLRWFLLLSVPILASAAACVIRGCGRFAAVPILLLGLGFSSVLFATLCSGMSSSNWGTYFRRHEPVRYWLDIVIMSAGYLLPALAGYCKRPADPILKV